jgi:hypothetical protein
MSTDELIAGLPGEALMREALADFHSGRQTIAACLVAIARTRLTRAGLVQPTAPASPDEPEMLLYDMLCLQGGDAYSRYNSLLRELVSFENAVELRLRKSGG